MEQVEESQVEAPEIETQARAQGWKPKEEYDGPEDKWRSAEDYVEFGKRLEPSLKRQRDDFKKQFEDSERKYKGLATTVEGLMKQAREKDKREYEAQLSFVNQQLKQYRAQGDHVTVATLEEERDKLKDNKPAEYVAPVVPQRQDTTLLDAWKESNPWFEGESAQDKKLTRYASMVGVEIKQARPELSGMAFFKAVEKQVKDDFPESFQRRRAPAVEGNTPGNGARGASGYASLPDAVKRACDKYVSEFAEKGKESEKRDEYVKLYNASN